MSDDGFDTRKLFPKTYLRAVDLDGKDVTAQISVVKNEPLPGEDDAHLVLYFVGKKKTLGLNVTNRKCLEKMFGFLTKEWHGKWITFGPVKQPKAADGISILIKGSPDIPETMTVQVTKYLPTVTLRKTRKPQGAPDPVPANVDLATGEVDDDLSTPFDDLPDDDIGFDGPEASQGPAGDDSGPGSYTDPSEAESGADGPIPGRGASREPLITVQQKRALNTQWMKLQDGGASKDECYDILEAATGKRSRSDLTVAEASQAVKMLAAEAAS